MVGHLPNFQNGDRDFQLMQTRWAEKIQPVLDLPINSGQILQNVTLAVGANQVNHRLGRKLQGWFLVRQRAAASVYDAQDTNQLPALTLSLVSSAAVSVDIFVF